MWICYLYGKRERHMNGRCPLAKNVHSSKRSNKILWEKSIDPSWLIQKNRLEIGLEFAKKTFNGILIPYHPQQLPIIIMFLSLFIIKKCFVSFRWSVHNSPYIMKVLIISSWLWRETYITKLFSSSFLTGIVQRWHKKCGILIQF